MINNGGAHEKIDLDGIRSDPALRIVDGVIQLGRPLSLQGRPLLQKRRLVGIGRIPYRAGCRFVRSFSLPPRYETVVIQGVPYYYAGRILLSRSPQWICSVAAPPAGQTDPGAPPGAFPGNNTMLYILEILVGILLPGLYRPVHQEIIRERAEAGMKNRIKGFYLKPAKYAKKNRMKEEEVKSTSAEDNEQNSQNPEEEGDLS